MEVVTAAKKGLPVAKDLTAARAESRPAAGAL